MKIQYPYYLYLTYQSAKENVYSNDIAFEWKADPLPREQDIQTYFFVSVTLTLTR